MTTDSIVQLIGIAMALTLVLANSRLRATPMRQRIVIGAAWVVIIAVTAYAFAGFHR
ncbi:hypothetical protein [Novosphingobium sp. FKTRR1]|uniref:hypothetical protein n=1 Tax=Novosphingobium sp. FKTRR1 TaxID=2879118 RepID=UPI001CEFFD77|nr:hypothetical protein [Novosphingobium sp. FKTRR1]